MNYAVRAARQQTNAYIGERVHTLMWRSGRTQPQLAAILGIDQGAVSNRLHGKTGWSAYDLDIVADWLGVDINDLLPPRSKGGAPIKRTSAPPNPLFLAPKSDGKRPRRPAKRRLVTAEAPLCLAS